MSLIALCAGKGSPGVTTAAVALAAVWPRPALVAECDPAGADLPLRLRDSEGDYLSPRRGIVSLAADNRLGSVPVDVLAHAQRIGGGLEVLVGPASATQAQALGPSWSALASRLAEPAPFDVLADCGRLQPGAVNGPVLARAQLVLVLLRPTLEGLAHLRNALVELISSLPGAGMRTGAPPSVEVVVVAAEPHRPALRQVAAALSAAELPVGLLGALALDPDAAAGLAGAPTRALDRSRLIESARRIASLADERLAQAGVGSDSLAGSFPASAPQAATPAAASVPAAGPVGWRP